MENHQETYTKLLITGAGDDEESWACGLQPCMLWANSKAGLHHCEGIPHELKSLLNLYCAQLLGI